MKETHFPFIVLATMAVGLPVPRLDLKNSTAFSVSE